MNDLKTKIESNINTEERRQPLGCFLIFIGFLLWFIAILGTGNINNFLQKISSLVLGFWIFYMGVLSVLSYKYTEECFLFKGIYDCCKKVLRPVGNDSNALYFGNGLIILGISFVIVSLFRLFG